MDEYVTAFKRKKRGFNTSSNYRIINKTNEEGNKQIKNLISKILLSIIFFLISIIYTNLSDKNLLLYKDYVLTESLPFTKIKGWYENFFGEVLPSGDNTQPVFNGKLMYKSIEDYYNGSKLIVNAHSLVSNIASGIVVYIGEKENYGNTVIIQGADGADIWYGNLTNISVKVYDYLEKETVIGEVDGEELYMIIKKENNYIKYEDYQN
ncbi:MAG: M23 family metallopeptidase [Bacilli bacterium]|nr:M23 family metallopeptidase [Bacilli bacterium]